MDPIDSSGEILNSWKQVAAYLGRGTRTVQRWEHDLGLPVRRPRGKSRSAIMALRRDLDAWVRNSPQINQTRNGDRAVRQRIPDDYPPIRNVSIRGTILASRGLRNQTRQLRNEMTAALTSLVASLKRIHPEDGPFEE